MRRKRILRTLPEKIKLIESAIEHKNIGQTLKSFVVDHDINYGQLSRWINEYKSGLFGKTKPKPESPGETPRLPPEKTPKLPAEYPAIIKTVADEFNRLTKPVKKITDNFQTSVDSRPVKVILYKTNEAFTENITFEFDIPRFSGKKEFEHYVMCEILRNVRWQVAEFKDNKKH